MPLPTQKTPAQPRMGKVLLYAEPKIGKSTLAATLDPDHTLLVDVEDGLSAIEGYKHRITSWGKIVGTTGDGKLKRPVYAEDSLLGLGGMLLAEEGKHPFKVAVIDTGDALAQLCSDYVLQQLGANEGSTGYVHASDFDYGKGWSAINDEWSKRIAALGRLIPSIVIISHADRRTRTTRAGAEFDAYSTNLAPKGVKEWTMGYVDQVLFLQMVDTEDGPVRGIRTQQGIGWQAGGRTVAGGPKLPDPILVPDALTSGETLRKALEAVTLPPQTPAKPPADDVDNAKASQVDDATAKKPAAKSTAKKPAAKSGGQEQLT